MKNIVECCQKKIQQLFLRYIPYYKYFLKSCPFRLLASSHYYIVETRLMLIHESTFFSTESFFRQTKKNQALEKLSMDLVGLSTPLNHLDGFDEKIQGIRPTFYPILPPPYYEESERVIGSIETFGTRRFPSKLNFGANHGIESTVFYYFEDEIDCLIKLY